MMGWIRELKWRLYYSWIGRLIRRIWNRLPKSRAFWLVIVGLILSGVGMGLGWDWLRSGTEEQEPNGTTLRNAGIVIAGIFALVFALWRGVVAERQAETAERQAETARQGLSNERYQRGAEMLGSETLMVRLGGIYALHSLAGEHPEQYHLQIMQLFCAFVRDPIGEVEIPVLRYEDDGEPVYGLREDVQAVMHAIGRRSDAGIALEIADRSFRLDLRNANLKGGVFEDVNFSYTVLSDANLFGAYFDRAEFNAAQLSGACLNDAHLSGVRLNGITLNSAVLNGATLSGVSLGHASLCNSQFRSATLFHASLACANLTGADLEDADLTRASFRYRDSGSYPGPATGLTQAQLDKARSDPNNPPHLEGVLDANTGEQLVWRGMPLDDDSAEPDA